MSYQWYIFFGSFLQLLWVFSLGACVGSLTNVLVYRLPRGLSIVSPPSACPSCGTKLTWRENIPILGWLLLRGKCRFCDAKISPEYPIVETVAGVLFAGLYCLWYILPDGGMSMLGIPFADFKPEWATNGIVRTWPAMLVVLTLFGCLLATTLIDARTYTIPLELTWVPVGLALVAHPVHALWVENVSRAGELPRLAGEWSWILASPGEQGWWWVGASIGGAVGVILANVLLHFGLLGRSFADYDEWEAAERAKQAGDVQGEAATDADGEDDPEDRVEHDPELWIQYPHARREMFKELLFLAPVIGLFALGGYVAVQAIGPGVETQSGRTLFETPVPMWLDALSGVLIGYLVGAGVIWAVRVLGSLAFGKEAMGLGDVHLLGAIGACLGWVDAVAAFFLACFAGAAWGIAGRLIGGKLARALPFGPYLAAGALLAVLGKPLIESGLTALFRVPGGIDLP